MWHKEEAPTKTRLGMALTQQDKSAPIRKLVSLIRLVFTMYLAAKGNDNVVINMADHEYIRIAYRTFRCGEMSDETRQGLSRCPHKVDR